MIDQRRAVFRVDHFLCMTAVQNLLGIGLANRQGGHRLGRVLALGAEPAAATASKR